MIKFDEQKQLDSVAGALAIRKEIEGIAADVADGYFCALCFFLYLFYQLFTTVLGKLREYQTDDSSVIGRVDAKVRLLNGALDGLSLIHI